MSDKIVNINGNKNMIENQKYASETYLTIFIHVYSWTPQFNNDKPNGNFGDIESECM